MDRIPGTCYKRIYHKYLVHYQIPTCSKSKSAASKRRGWFDISRCRLSRPCHLAYLIHAYIDGRCCRIPINSSPKTIKMSNRRKSRDRKTRTDSCHAVKIPPTIILIGAISAIFRFAITTKAGFQTHGKKSQTKIDISGKAFTAILILNKTYLATGHKRIDTNAGSRITTAQSSTFQFEPFYIKSIYTLCICRNTTDKVEPRPYHDRKWFS